MMYWNGMGWGGWIMMTITMVAIWAVVAAAVAALLSSMRGNGPWSRRPRDPFDLLDERFARGEIDEEEYRRRRDILTMHH